MFSLMWALKHMHEVGVARVEKCDVNCVVFASESTKDWKKLNGLRKGIARWLKANGVDLSRVRLRVEPTLVANSNEELQSVELQFHVPIE